MIKTRANEIRIAKLFSFILLFHINISIMYYPIARLPLLLGAILGLTILIYYVRTNHTINQLFPFEVKLYILFFFVALVSGYFVSIRKDVLVDTSFTLAQTVILMICLLAIVQYDKSLRYIELLIVGVSFFMSMVVISGVDNIQLALAGREEMYKNSVSKMNPNSVGLSQVAAFFIQVTWMRRVFTNRKMNTKQKFLMKLCLLFLLMSISVIVVLISGSRKSFLAVALVLVFTFVFAGNGKIVKKLLSISISILFILGLFWIGGKYLDDLYIFQRFTTFFEENSNTTRINMIKEGLQILQQSPLFGVGLGNYTYASSFGTYSHNTFAEALSTTGLIGSTIYFTTYITIFYKLVKLTKNERTKVFAYDGIVLFGVLIFLAIGVIHFYSISSSLLFSYLIGGIMLSNKYYKRRIKRL